MSKYEQFKYYQTLQITLEFSYAKVQAIITLEFSYAKVQAI